MKASRANRVFAIRAASAAASILSIAVISIAQDAPPATQPAAASATQPSGDDQKQLTPAAKIAKAKSDLAAINTALQEFEIDCGRFPTTAEGLRSLVTNPANLTGWTQYLTKLPVDPWEKLYIYHCPGSSGQDYDLYSSGPNAKNDHQSGDDIVK